MGGGASSSRRAAANAESEHGDMSAPAVRARSEAHAAVQAAQQMQQIPTQVLQAWPASPYTATAGADPPAASAFAAPAASPEGSGGGGGGGGDDDPEALLQQVIREARDDLRRCWATVAEEATVQRVLWLSVAPAAATTAADGGSGMTTLPAGGTQGGAGASRPPSPGLLDMLVPTSSHARRSAAVAAVATSPAQVIRSACPSACPSVRPSVSRRAGAAAAPSLGSPRQLGQAAPWPRAQRLPSL
jgi:hypothetical protein